MLFALRLKEKNKVRLIKFLFIFFIFIFYFIGFSHHLSAQVQFEPILKDSPGAPKATDLNGYLRWLFLFGLALAGVFALAQVTIGGLQIVMGGANESSISEGKKRINDALWGLGLALCVWLILYLINPELVNIKFQLKDLPEASVSPQSTTSYTLNCVNCLSFNDPNYSSLKNFLKSDACGGANKCQINSGVADKLKIMAENLKSSGMGNGWVITEAYPPTATHSSPGHYNGTCVDVAVTGDAAKRGCDSVYKMIEAAKKSGLSVLNEDSRCGGRATEKSTGPHLHICG